MENLIDRVSKLETKPKWFCLVLSKTDLYKASDAVSYYESNPKFKSIVERLNNIFDKDKISLFIPSCSDISSIAYGKTNIHPKYVKNKDDSLGMLVSFFLLLK